MSYLVDTNDVSEPLRQQPAAGVIRRLHEGEGGIAIPAPILDYDWQAADWHARERARLTAAGRTPLFVDGQIAAIAHVNGRNLMTSNVADFRAFEGLAVENWI